MEPKEEESYQTRYALHLPNLDNRLLDDRGSSIVLNLDVLFTIGNSLLLVFLHGSQPYYKEDKTSFKKKEKKRKKERKMDDTYFDE